MIAPFIGIKELRTRLPLAQSTLYKLVEDQKIPHHRVGQRILFLWSEVHEWIMNASGEIQRGRAVPCRSP